MSQKYDRETQEVIEKVCVASSNAIDVGAHEGAILDLILERAPQGIHFAFEPLPDFYESLKSKYRNTNCVISNIAVSDREGESTFNYVVSNPTYSGLKKRKYARENEEDTQITVALNKLDNVIPSEVKIDFVKIDVEGAEFSVLKGAKSTIEKNQPIIVFEFGIGGSDFYGTTPQDIFQFFENLKYKVSTMENWLKKKPAFKQSQLEKEYQEETNCYFIAYPKA